MGPIPSRYIEEISVPHHRVKDDNLLELTRWDMHSATELFQRWNRRRSKLPNLRVGGTDLSEHCLGELLQVSPEKAQQLFCLLARASKATVVPAAGCSPWGSQCGSSATGGMGRAVSAPPGKGRMMLASNDTLAGLPTISRTPSMGPTASTRRSRLGPSGAAMFGVAETSKFGHRWHTKAARGKIATDPTPALQVMSVNFYELIAGITTLSSGTVEQKIDFLYHVFDGPRHDNLLFFPEVVLLMRTVLLGLARFLEMPEEWHLSTPSLERVVVAIFRQKEVPPQGALSPDQFREMLKEMPEAVCFLRITCVPHFSDAPVLSGFGLYGRNTSEPHFSGF